MSTLVGVIEACRIKLDRCRREDLKEYPTRVIFVDPILQALGWDVRDPSEVELEYTTIDGKAVDYALKVNRRPVMFVEAKPLNDPLTDVKAITQVISYAANAGIEWCVLTNGVIYRVYRSTEKARAPDKLLYEISLDPTDTEGMTIDQVADLFHRFSQDAMARGVLDEIGEQIFTLGKIRKVLDRLFSNPPDALVRLVRKGLQDDSIKPAQIRTALQRLWTQTPDAEDVDIWTSPEDEDRKPERRLRGGDYGETHHLSGMPLEVVELYRALDQFCRELDPARVEKKHLSKYIRWSHGKNTFCSTHLQKSGLRVWLKLRFADLHNPPAYSRDVSSIGHWGLGDVELAVDSLRRLDEAKSLIRQSFEANRMR